MGQILRKVNMFALVIMLVSGLIFAACAPAPKPLAPPLAPLPAPPAPKLPEVIKLTSVPLGSLGYTLLLGLSEAVKEKTGITTRVIPRGGAVARVLPVRAGEADFVLITGADAYYVAHGLFEFASEEWGPQPIRVVWNGTPGGAAMITRGDAGIKTMADLKGKRIASVAGQPMFEVGQTGLLAFGGLTWKDVTKVYVPSSAAGFKAILEGAVDSMWLATTAAGSYELAASKHGVYFIPTPKADVEAWKRLWVWAPYTAPALIDRGAGPQFEKGAKAELSIFAYPILAYKHHSADWVYAYTKGIGESYDLYKGKHPELPYWTQEWNLNYKLLTYAYHEGAVKFFKEKGIWTPAHEEWQSRQVKLETARLPAWPEAIKAAEEKKIKLGTPEFQEFWEKWLKERNLISYCEL